MEILLSLILSLPLPSLAMSWDIDGPPGQVYLEFENDLQVSYRSYLVPCTTKAARPEYKVYRSTQCWLVDHSSPSFVRSELQFGHKKWLSLEIKTYNGTR